MAEEGAQPDPIQVAPRHEPLTRLVDYRMCRYVYSEIITPEDWHAFDKHRDHLSPHLYTGTSGRNWDVIKALKKTDDRPMFVLLEVVRDVGRSFEVSYWMDMRLYDAEKAKRTSIFGPVPFGSFFHSQ